ncbi:MAG TPA: hypothetical protein PKE12_00740 [Kiritimatiellia bacterium]|nr:hypothetical protein [Kiritimatiellia bacterium]
MKRHVFAAMIFATLLTGTIQAQQDLSQDQVAAYVAVVKADLARDAGSVAEARRHYQEAADLYTAIAKKDPAWHPDIVEFRLSYCQSQLEALRGRAEGVRPPDTADGQEPGRPDPATAEAMQRLVLLEEENKELHEQAITMETELAALSNRLQQAINDAQKTDPAPESKSKSRETEKLRKEIQAGEDARAELLKERDALQKEIARITAAGSRSTEEVKADLARMREQLEASARELDATREAALKLLQPGGDAQP